MARALCNKLNLFQLKSFPEGVKILNENSYLVKTKHGSRVALLVTCCCKPSLEGHRSTIAETTCEHLHTLKIKTRLVIKI